MFRFTNIMTMQCALQLRVTYCKSIKLFHTCADGSSLTDIDESTGIEKNDSDVAQEKDQSDQLTVKMHDDETDQRDDAVSVVISKYQPTAVYKSSKCFVILERETQTSSRDWRHDQKL